MKFLFVTFVIGIVISLAMSPAFGQVTFIDMAQQWGVTHEDDTRGVAIVDLESDGRNEIVVVNKFGYNRLYKWNWETSSYDELGEEYGIAETVQHHNITVADVDKDLNPDLYITSHIGLPDARYYLNLGYAPFQDVAEEYNLDELHEMGSAFFQLTPHTGVSGLLGGRLMIRENDIFVDYTEGSGLEHITNQHTPIFFDIDGDIDADLFIAGNHETNTGRLFRNNSDTTFSDISYNTNEGGFPVGQGLSVGDIDNDGDFDFYLSSGFGVNSMWQNDGTGYFTNVTGWSNTDYAGYTRAVCFGDYDNDGDVDLFLNRGMAPNALLLNNGNGQFTDFSQEAGIDDFYNGYAAAVGDLNNDGQLDIVATNCDFYPTCVYINQNQNPSWLKVRLIGRPANSLALGARIKLWGVNPESGDTVLLGMRRIASLTSIHSVDDLVAHFGTGVYQDLTIEVTFASLEVVHISNLIPGQTITVVEHQTDIDESGTSLPYNYLSISAYPNPFNNSTKIAVKAKNGVYSLTIYDILGRIVKNRELAITDNSASFTWDGTNNDGSPVPSGLYLAKVYNSRHNATAKITLLR